MLAIRQILERRLYKIGINMKSILASLCANCIHINISMSVENKAQSCAPLIMYRVFDKNVSVTVSLKIY